MGSDVINRKKTVPIPEFHFDDEGQGLPPKAVPVRFACIAAGIIPRHFATILSGGGPYAGIKVYEYDETSGATGEVDPERYSELFSEPHGQTYSDINAFPANHFVWSDDLAKAFYDDYLYVMRQYQVDPEHREEIRWCPALGENRSAIDACPDISSLVKYESSPNIIRYTNDIWSISYNGLHVNIPDQKGIHYIKILLLHPQVEYSIQDLHIEVNPPPPTPDVSLQEFMPTDEDSDESTGISIGGLGDAGETIDAQARQQYRDRIAAISDEIEDADEFGNADRRLELEEEAIFLNSQLSADTGMRGQPRIIGGVDEKIRKSISIAIVRAITCIFQIHPDLGQHLKTSIKTGYSCSYQPAAETRWQY